MNDDDIVEKVEVDEKALLLEKALRFLRLCYLHYFSGFSHQMCRESRCFYFYVMNKETESLKS